MARRPIEKPSTRLLHPTKLKIKEVMFSLGRNATEYASNAVSIQFGLSNCAIIASKRGMIACVQTADVSYFLCCLSPRSFPRGGGGCTQARECMPDGEEFWSLGEDSSYKYLGVLETDQIKQEEMKGKIEAEYFSRVRNVLKSKLNAGNTIKAINTWSVSLVRYVAGPGGGGGRDSENLSLY